MDGSKTRNRPIPDARVHDSKLVYEHPGRWYLVIPFDKPVISTQTPYKDISRDPVLRGFRNVYSDDAKLEGVFDLNKRVEVVNNLHSKIKRAQWLRSKSNDRDLKRHCTKRMDMVWAKIRNKKDMPGKTIRFMVDNFRIGDMGAKFIVQNKMMNKGTKFQQSFLSTYEFRQRLLEHKTTRTIVVVDEAFTTKTCCTCGWIHNTIGSEKVFNCGRCGSKMDEILTQLPVFISKVNLIPNTTRKRLGPSYGPRYISRMILCEIVLKLTIIHRNVVFDNAHG